MMKKENNSPTINKYRLERLHVKQNGYIKIPKSMFELCSSGLLGAGEFQLYFSLYTIFVDWDVKHKTTFGAIKPTTNEISQIVNKSNSSVNKNLKLLENKGLIYMRKDAYYALSGYGVIRRRMKPIKGEKVGAINILSEIEKSIIKNEKFINEYEKFPEFINLEYIDFVATEDLSKTELALIHISSSFKGDVSISTNEDIDIDEIIKDLGDELDLEKIGGMPM